MGLDMLHVVVVGAHSSFEPAVIARTLYTGLGLDEPWRMTIHARAKRLKIVIESRVPVRTALERIRFVRNVEEVGDLEQPVYLVDARGGGEEPSGKPATILVCLDEFECNPLLEKLEYKRVSTLSCGNPVYETIALIYWLFIRGRRPRMVMPREAPLPSLVQPVLYIARKLLEAVEWFDNRILLKPSVVAHTLNKALTPYNLVVDLEDWSVEVREHLKQVIRLQVYDWRLRPMGEVKVVFDTGTRLVRIEGVPVFDVIEVALDPEHGRACIGPTIHDCIEVSEARRVEAVEEAMEGFFSGL